MQNMQNLPNKPTKPNLPNQTYQTNHTKPNLPNQSYQTNHTKPNLPNKIYWSKQWTPGSEVPLAMFFIIPAVHRIPFRSRQRMRQLCLLIRLHQFGHRHLDRTPSQKSMLFGIIFKYDKGCTNKVYLEEERQLFLLALICKLVHRLEELLKKS